MAAWLRRTTASWDFLRNTSMLSCRASSCSLCLRDLRSGKAFNRRRCSTLECRACSYLSWSFSASICRSSARFLALTALPKRSLPSLSEPSRSRAATSSSIFSLRLSPMMDMTVTDRSAIMSPPRTANNIHPRVLGIRCTRRLVEGTMNRTTSAPAKPQSTENLRQI